MFRLSSDSPCNQILNCRLDQDTVSEMRRFSRLTGQIDQTASKLVQIWQRFLEVVKHLFPCISLHFENKKNKLIAEAKKEIQTDLNRSFNLILNGTRYEDSETFIKALVDQKIPEEKAYTMLMFSYQKAWAIFMTSQIQSNPNGVAYMTLLPKGFQSNEWNVAASGKITLTAKHTFSLLASEGLSPNPEGEKEVTSFTFEYNVGEKEITYKYEPLPWRKLLFKACSSICNLKDTSSLQTIMETMHETNVTWSRDVRQEVLKLYNQGRPTHLPTEWDGTDLTRLYDIDVTALRRAFNQITEGLKEPTPLSFLG